MRTKKLRKRRVIATQLCSANKKLEKKNVSEKETPSLNEIIVGFDF